MIPLCQYILQGDQQCEQAAIKGGHYCRHHQVVRKSVAAAEAEGELAHPSLPFHFPSDHGSQLYNYYQVLQALNEGRLNNKTANMMIRLLKACDASLKAAVAEVVQLCEAELSNEPDSESDKDQIADQDEAADDEERIKIAAAREPARVRNEPTYPAQQTREPLDLLRHSRGMNGRRRA